jgi:hypothetical protein
MATSSITTGGRKWEEHWYVYSSIGGLVAHKKRTHSLATVKTVGYEGATEAASAAAEASIAEGVIATYEREGDADFYSVTVETDTVGEWTDVPLS